MAHDDGIHRLEKEKVVVVADREASRSVTSAVHASQLGSSTLALARSRSKTFLLVLLFLFLSFFKVQSFTVQTFKCSTVGRRLFQVAP